MSLSAPDEPTPREVVDHYVGEQCRVITEADAPLRQGAGSVHDTRVAIRRLRSTLRVFALAFEPTAAAQLSSDLTWYAALLGEIRDREVLRLRLAAAVAALPSGLVMGPVAAHIDDHLLGEQRFHQDELVRAMQRERYQTLSLTLTEWAAGPPYTIDVDDPELLVKVAAKAASKTNRRLAEAHSTHDSPTALHRARKSAKRARYSAELVEPLDARKAGARIRHFKRVQAALGTYQDSVIAAELLRRLGAGAGTLPGHNGFTYGLLYAQEVQAGEAALEESADL